MIRINANKVTDQEGRDISDKLIHYLFENVEFGAEPFTLQDVFSLMELNPMLKDVYRQNFAYELCKEAAKGPSQKAIEANWRKKAPEAEDLECIELYEYIEFNSRLKETDSATGFMQMHALSFPLMQDEENYGKKGDVIQFSVSLTPVRDLLLLPVKIKSEVLVTEDDIASKSFGNKLLTFNKKSYSLGRIFEGLLWEISFHGAPSEQEERIEELQDRVSDLSDPEKTMSFLSIDDVDVFYEIYANEFDRVFTYNGEVSGWVKNKVYTEVKDLEDSDVLTKYKMVELVFDAQSKCNISEEKMVEFQVKESFENLIKSIDFKPDFLSIHGHEPTAIMVRVYGSQYS